MLRRMLSSSTAPPPPAGTCKLALCQLLPGRDKAANLAAASAAIAHAAREGAHMVALPECFNSPYATSEFPVYAETVPATAADADDSEASRLGGGPPAPATRSAARLQASHTVRRTGIARARAG